MKAQDKQHYIDSWDSHVNQLMQVAITLPAGAESDEVVQIRANVQRIQRYTGRRTARQGQARLC